MYGIGFSVACVFLFSERCVRYCVRDVWEGGVIDMCEILYFLVFGVWIILFSYLCVRRCV